MISSQYGKLCSLTLDQDQKQTLQIGAGLFPLSVFYNDLEQMPAHKIPWHWHEEVELIYMVEGTIHVEIVQNKIQLKSGEGLFINANMLHCVFPDSSKAFFISLVFDAHMLADAGNIIQSKFITPLITSAQIPYILFSKTEGWHQEVTACIYSVAKLFEERSYGYELLIREKLSHIWYLLVIHKPPAKQPQSEGIDLQRMKLMMAYIHTHFQQDISLQMIAQAALISDREALRCFHKTIHDSPISYLLKYRITKASEYLIQSDRSITEVSLLCGFKDASYFAKIFKRHVKQTPRAYRKAHRIGKSQ